MTPFGRFRPAASVFLIMTTLAMALAPPVGAQGPSFKSGVDMVPLTVTVTDNSGRHVAGLTGRDFKVYEDGVEQSITFFATDEVPVDVALVLDTSGSMMRNLPLVQAAAIGLVRRLRPCDRAAVVNIKERAEISQAFTSDPQRAERAVRSLSAAGATALYDGIYIVLKEFARDRKVTAQLRRQMLVVLSDGLDNTSHVTFENVLDFARRSEVNIYVIALRDALLPTDQQNSSALEADYSMGAMARESGGQLFVPKSAYQLRGIYCEIAQEFLGQYELGYVPSRPAGSGGFRRVAVRVSPPTNALARTRSGYYAGGDTTAK